MSRLVQPTVYRTAPVDSAQFESVGGGGKSAELPKTIEKAGDSYIDRVAKYIPGEVLAAYLVLDGAAQLYAPKDVAQAIWW